MTCYTSDVTPATDPALAARLVAIIREIVGPARGAGPIGASTPLRDGGLGLDSVALLELIVAVETQLEVDFDPTTDFGEAALRTVGTFAAVIGRRRRRT